MPLTGTDSREHMLKNHWFFFEETIPLLFF